ncbi:MAG: NAD(P)H-hydrate epimerase, partial [Enterobacterales bacterium]|nr:NAD(P)H-hydrate epimerase [Enterobacterales bacterium]
MTGHYQKHFNSSLPYSVYPADNVRELEQRAVSELGLSLYQLMERAGQATFHRARQFYPTTRRWLVLCGHGNNGGDGYVVARLARQLGIQVTLVAVEHNGPLPPEAQQARDAWIRTGGEIQG